MTIDTFKYTNRGKYDINEDSLYCGTDTFAVADGLGGLDHGEAASACAVKIVSENAAPKNDSGLIGLVTAANKAVCALGNGACTTVAAAVVHKNVFRYIHIGDSRVYYFKKGNVFARTKDHSVCQAAVDLGDMSEEEIRGSEDRSKLIKVLGNDPELKIGKINDPITIENGDAFLICSDGFWEYVYESEMESALKRSDSAEQWVNYMLDFHIKRSKFDCDNFSAVCGIFRLPR